jgi:hypothetical protein
MPKRVFVVEELPRNAMGKVQKNISARHLRGYLRRGEMKHDGLDIYPSRPAELLASGMSILEI